MLLFLSYILNIGQPSGENSNFYEWCRIKAELYITSVQSYKPPCSKFQFLTIQLYIKYNLHFSFPHKMQITFHNIPLR